MHSDSADDDEAGLFREAMRGVRPRQSPNRVPERRPRPPARPRQKEADEKAVLEEMMDSAASDSGDELGWRSEGIQDSVFRRLKRGNYRVADEVDLHGLRANEAKHVVREFIARSRARDHRCVRIIHGKGLRSSHRGPVLKHQLEGWLRQREDVLAYCSARREDGGTGAVYVLLRRGR